jgi:hypothetical protein
MSALMSERANDWHEAHGTELSAMYACNAWQNEVEKRKRALDQAKDDLWSATPAWVPETE